MKLVISDEIRERFPKLRIAIVLVDAIDGQILNDELAMKNKQKLINFATKFEDVKEFVEEKNISVWRDIYRSFGINPKKKKPSAEAFLSRVIKDGFIPNINTVVDTYLSAESIHYLPVGGYDLHKISGDIQLCLAHGEEFLGMGNDIPELTNEGEIIYRDDARVLTRCWNYRDCDYTKIWEETKRFALFIEAPVEEISDTEIIETGKFIADNLEKYCNASCRMIVMKQDENEIELTSLKNNNG